MKTFVYGTETDPKILKWPLRVDEEDNKKKILCSINLI